MKKHYITTLIISAMMWLSLIGCRKSETVELKDDKQLTQTEYGYADVVILDSTIDAEGRDGEYYYNLMMEAYDNKNYSLMDTYLFKSASLGNPNAAWWMGWNGERSLKPAELVFGWYEKAAAGGDTAAYIRLGHLYNRGYEGVCDYIEARKWYELAVKNNCADDEVVNALKILPKSDDYFGLCRYALQYNEESSKYPDFVLGYVYALKGGFADGYEGMENIFPGEYLYAGVLREDYSGSAKQAKKIMQTVAHQVYETLSSPSWSSSKLYADIVRNDYLKMYQKNANEGVATAQYLMAKLYDEGIVVNKDKGKAKYYFELAKAQNLSPNGPWEVVGED